MTQSGPEEPQEASDDEEVPQCVMYTSSPYDPEGEEGQDTSESESEGDTASETSQDSTEDSESATDDEESMAEGVGDIYEQGYLDALQGQNVQPEEEISKAQREVFLANWKGARRFGGRSQSRDKKNKSS